MFSTWAQPADLEQRTRNVLCG